MVVLKFIVKFYCGKIEDVHMSHVKKKLFKKERVEMNE
jgi:hypothetical protein